MQNVLTTAEAGTILGVNASRVRQLILSGQLKAEKMGRDLIINKREVVALAKLRRRAKKSNGR